MTENYPGQNTEFYIVIGGVPAGPYRGLVEVFRHNISPDTPVWYDGLSDWTPALLADHTRQIFTPSSPFYNAHPEALQIMQGRMAGADPDTLPTLVDDPEVPEPETPVIRTSPTTPTSSASPTASATPGDSSPEKPNAYLTLAIVVTIVCFFPTGLMAVYYASRVNSMIKKGNIEYARSASETAQWWIAATIVLGLFFTATMILTGGLFPYGI